MPMTRSAGQSLLTALSASVFSFYNLTVFSLMNVLSVYLVQDLALSPVAVGFLSSWDLWGNVLGFVPVGILLDRFNIRYIACGLLSLAIVSTAAMAFTDQIMTLCFLRFLQGLSSAGSLLVLMRVGSLIFPGHINKTIGLMILLALSGGVVGNSVFAYCASHFGWRNALMLVSLTGVMCLLIMATGLQSGKMQTQSTSFKKILTRGTILSGIHLGILNTPVFVLGSLFGNQYLMNQLHVTLEQASIFSSVLFSGIIIGSPIMGYLADKTSNFVLLTAGYIGLIVCAMVLSFSTLVSYATCLVLFFGLGLFSCTQNLIYPLINQNPAAFRSITMGISAMIANAVGAALQLLFGFIAMVKISAQYQVLLVIFISGFIFLRVYYRSLNFHNMNH